MFRGAPHITEAAYVKRYPVGARGARGHHFEEGLIMAEIVIIGAIGFLFGGAYGAAVAIVGFFVLALILAILNN
jgi:hypothetical protein